MNRKSFFKSLGLLAASPATVCRLIAAQRKPKVISTTVPWSGIKFDPTNYQGELTWCGQDWKLMRGWPAPTDLKKPAE